MFRLHCLESNRLKNVKNLCLCMHVCVCVYLSYTCSIQTHDKNQHVLTVYINQYYCCTGSESERRHNGG